MPVIHCRGLCGAPWLHGFLILVNSVSKSMKLQCERGQGNKGNALLTYVSVVLLCAAWLFLLGCQNKGSLSSWTPGLLMDHDTFGFQMPGDEENEREQWSALHSAISFKYHFLFCNCLGLAVWKWLSCVYALLKNVIPFFFSFSFFPIFFWFFVFFLVFCFQRRTFGFLKALVFDIHYFFHLVLA